MSRFSEEDPEKIHPELYFLIIDNKKGRKFVTLEMGKVKLSKKLIDLSFFKDKKLNTYWDLSDDKNYIEITEKEFKNEEELEQTLEDKKIQDEIEHDKIVNEHEKAVEDLKRMIIMIKLI